MKKKAELQKENTSAMEEVQRMLGVLVKEEREFTEDEQTEYDNQRSIIENTNKLIERVEELDEINRNIQPEEIIENKPQEKMKEKFSIFEAVRQAHAGNLQGEALEVHKRAEAQGVQATNPHTLLVGAEAINMSGRAMDVADGAALIHKDVATDLDIVVPVPLYQKLGFRVLTGLNGTLGLPTQLHNEATFPGEDVTVIDNPNEPTGKTLTPKRVGLTQSFTKELLNSGNSALFSSIISDMVAGIDSAITRYGISQAIAGMTAGNTIDGSALTIDAKALTNLESLVEVDGKFVFDRARYALLKATPVTDGDSRTVINGKFSSGETFDGYPCFGTTYCPTSEIVYGDWNHATVGMWDGIEIIVDPYTGAKKGKIEITVNRLVDVQVRNAEAFSMINLIP